MSMCVYTYVIVYVHLYIHIIIMSVCVYVVLHTSMYVNTYVRTIYLCYTFSLSPVGLSEGDRIQGFTICDFV